MALTAQGLRTRARIVSGAAAVIHERGAEAASVEEILARAGASKSQLYHYFEDKDALVRAVIAHQFERVLAASSPALDAVASWAAVRAWFEAIVAAQAADGCRHGCPVGSLAAELADRDERARVELALAFAAWEERIAAALARLAASGRLRRGTDVRALATATLAAIQGGLLLSKTVRDPEPLRRALDANYAYLRTFAAAGSSRKRTTPPNVPA